MLKSLKFAAALLVAGTVSASAATVAFTPTNDPSGHVYTQNSNDGWSGRRGIGFEVTEAKTINSVGLYQHLTKIGLSYWVSEISSLTGNFTRTALLRSGTAMTTTQGLSWVDFSFADLDLSVGKKYLIEFAFDGNSKKNFFYNNANVAWSQNGFAGLEGTAGNSFGNSVVAAVRVGAEEQVSAVPLPAGLPLLLGGMAVMGWMGRRRRA